MDRGPPGSTSATSHGPHVRGDGPDAAQLAALATKVSPWTWGWTVDLVRYVWSAWVPTGCGEPPESRGRKPRSHRPHTASTAETGFPNVWVKVAGWQERIVCSRTTIRIGGLLTGRAREGSFLDMRLGREGCRPSERAAPDLSPACPRERTAADNRDDCPV